jgi:tRNA uridine 5-carbamoylmethylation protein Kti12
MPSAIIIRGPAAVGKTTVAKSLATTLKARYIGLDELLKKHKLDNIEGEGISAANFLEANKHAIPLALKELKSGTSVVFDGCFYRKSQIQNLVSALKSYKVLMFSLNASVKECLKRNSKRKNPLNKEDVVQVYRLTKKAGMRIETAGRNVQEIVGKISSLIIKQKFEEKTMLLRAAVKQAGLTREDVKKAIKDVRNAV